MEIIDKYKKTERKLRITILKLRRHPCDLRDVLRISARLDGAFVVYGDAAYLTMTYPSGYAVLKLRDAEATLDCICERLDIYIRWAKKHRVLAKIFWRRYWPCLK